MNISTASGVAALLGSRVMASSTRNAISNSLPDLLSASITTSAYLQSKKGRLKGPLPRVNDGSRRRMERKTAARGMGGNDDVDTRDTREGSATTSSNSNSSSNGQTSTIPQPRPELVDRFLRLATPKEQRQVALQSVIREFARFPGDTGSSEVQVALLTSKISSLAEHLKVHRKDYSSKRGLMAMLNQRRQMLQYLRRSDFERYSFCLSKLGLKDLGKTYDRLSARYSD